MDGAYARQAVHKGYLPIQKCPWQEDALEVLPLFEIHRITPQQSEIWNRIVNYA